MAKASHAYDFYFMWLIDDYTRGLLSAEEVLFDMWAHKPFIETEDKFTKYAKTLIEQYHKAPKNPDFLLGRIRESLCSWIHEEAPTVSLFTRLMRLFHA